MDTQAWEQVKQLFGEALEVEAGRRRAWVEARCGDEAVRREVLNLLEEYSHSEEFLEDTTLALQSAVQETLEGRWEGRQIGSWRLVREIGRGGMGVVFEALREGEGFQARFALKLIRAGLATERLAERFRNERRVLAGLAHPGIAALIDGGTTPEGLPYLVMEYVQGVPLDRWLREQQPDLKGRLLLMAAVCDAVRHAHERLVIHRDLKPGNILVTEDGRPKLLDFGIAKLLDEGPETQGSQTVTYVLTPEYASPEQMTGGPATTATDIYSLGVLLFFVLTGGRPYDLAGLSPLEAMRRVAESEPKPPSAAAAKDLRRILRGDLDNIVLKCLRKDPAERYRSADALAQDLQAWLDGRPVSATRPSMAYRLGKWVRRNRGQALALTAVALSLVAGGIGTAWQAREASLERRRAEQRALEIQKLSRALVFDIHGALLQVPGSTEARALLLDRAMQFFDGAARTARGDGPLLVELAEGYRRLGNVLGSSFSDNLGRREQALDAFGKGLEIVRTAEGQGPDPFQLLRTHAGLLVEAGLAAAGMQRREEAERHLAELERVNARIEQQLSGQAGGRALAAVNWGQMGMIRTILGPREESIRLHRKALAAFEALPAAEADDAGNLSQKAFVHKRLGAALMATRPDESEQEYLKGLAIDRELVRRNPGDRAQLFNMTFALSDLGLIARMRGQWEKSRAYLTEAAAIRDRFHAEDPHSVRGLAGAMNVHCQLSLVEAQLGRFGEARRESGLCEGLARELGAAEGDAGCGRGPVAMITGANAALMEASRSSGVRRAQRLARARSLVTRAKLEHAACSQPFAGFGPAMANHEELTRRLGF